VEPCTTFVLCSQYVLLAIWVLAYFRLQWPNLKAQWPNLNLGCPNYRSVYLPPSQRGIQAMLIIQTGRAKKLAQVREVYGCHLAIDRIVRSVADASLVFCARRQVRPPQLAASLISYAILRLHRLKDIFESASHPFRSSTCDGVSSPSPLRAALFVSGPFRTRARSAGRTQSGPNGAGGAELGPQAA
jgi:hypothetical protein